MRNVARVSVPRGGLRLLRSRSAPLMGLLAGLAVACSLLSESVQAKYCWYSQSGDAMGAGGHFDTAHAAVNARCPGVLQIDAPGLLEDSQAFFQANWHRRNGRGEPSPGAALGSNWLFTDLLTTVNNRRANIILPAPAALTQPEVDTLVEQNLLAPLRRLFALYGPPTHTLTEMYQIRVIDAFVQTALAFTSDDPTRPFGAALGPHSDYKAIIERKVKRGQDGAWNVWDDCAALLVPPNNANVPFIGSLDFSIEHLGNFISAIEAKRWGELTNGNYYQLYSELISQVGHALQNFPVHFLPMTERRYGVVSSGKNWGFATCHGTATAWVLPAPPPAGPYPPSAASRKYDLSCSVLHLTSALNSAGGGLPPAGIAAGANSYEIDISAELANLPVPGTMLPPAMNNVLMLLVHTLY